MDIFRDKKFIKSVIEKIDITYLKPNLSSTMMDNIMAIFLKYNFASLCLPINYIYDIKRKYNFNDKNITTVIGFPFGYEKWEIKKIELEDALSLDIDEFDVVMNIYAFINQDYDYVLDELKNIRKLTYGKIMKVIIETAYLDKKSMIGASEIVLKSGADFIKTSTGFAPMGAKIEDVLLIKEKFGDKILIKASGGIKTFDDAVSFINAGVDRVGMSDVSDVISAYERAE